MSNVKKSCQRDQSQWYVKFIGWILVVVVVIPFIQSCAKSSIPPPRNLPEIGLSSGEVKNRLVGQYNDWRGVPYRNGGQSKRGIDCSAFVQLTYHEEFRLNLPRTTEQLSRSGQQISTSGLRAGDLVLFKTSWSNRHVGMYLEHSKFLHVSTIKGVMVSKLSDPYWQEHFWQARRVFN